MKNKILLFFAAAIYIFLFFPWMDWSIQVKAVGTLVIIQLLWVGRVFPLAYSSLLLIAILSFHFFSYEEVLGYLGSSLVWLLFSTFILAHAFVNTGLASRVSLSILNLARGSERLLTFLSFIMMFILTIFVPSNIGKGKLISEILDDILINLKKIHNVRNLGRSLFIGVAYISAMSAAFVPTGASSTIYAFGMFSSVYEDMSYFKWLVIFSFPILLFVFILWIVFQVIFPNEKVDEELVKNLIASKKEKLGKWKPEEIRMAFIMGVTLLLWLTQSWHGYSIPLVGMLGAILSMFPSIGVMKWDEAKKGINWDMMIFFAATLMLSNMLIDTGTMDQFTNWLLASFEAFHPIWIVIIFFLLVALARIAFVNVLGFLTIMIPLSMNLGDKINGFSSLDLAMGAYLLGVPGFLLITQSPVHLISYSYGHYSQKDLLRAGFIAMTSWLIIIFISVFFYWKLVT